MVEVTLALTRRRKNERSTWVNWDCERLVVVTGAPTDSSNLRLWTDDKPKEACGVFGIYATGRTSKAPRFDGLYCLQHRGPRIRWHGGFPTAP